MSVRLLLLGPPTIDAEGASRPLLFERRHQLLVYLAWRGGWVARSELAALLWPDQSDKQAYTNVRKVVHRLQELSWLSGFEGQSHALRLEVATDMAVFEASLREGRVGEALALRRGEFLAGYDDPSNEAWTQWLQQERERWRTLWRGTVLDHLPSLGEAGRRIELSSQLLAIDAFDEAALQAHAEALLEAGQVARAQAVWQDFVVRLQRELGVEPSSALRVWHDRWAQSDARPPAEAGAARSRPAVASHDGFVGRSSELHQIDALLSGGEVRLLTLLGPGGVGKTRLARRLLEEFSGRFDGAAGYVALEDVTDSAHIAPRMARDLGLALSDRIDALQQVITELKGRAQLLVLDNLEQLAGQAQVLVQLLQACPRLVIVATSRVRLALPGEQLFPLQGLPCPDAEDQDRLEAFDAARLFIRAARRVEPALVPSAEAAAIVEICRLVDGLPLALELAASWTRAMSCEAIAEELRRGTELLSTADPARPTRQASMAAVFEQSWTHLGASERRALAALSLFRGGFTAAAARQVAGASAPVLASLADRSLLRRDDTGRLHLHPLVQQFAADRLGTGEARRSAADAHAQHYLGLLMSLDLALRRADRDATRGIDLEFDNVRQAWLHAAQTGAVDLLGRAAFSLMRHCDLRGRHVEGRDLLLDAARNARSAGHDRIAARLQSSAAHMAYRLDRYDDALAEAAAVLGSEAGQSDERARTQCYRVIGATRLQTGQLDEARRHFELARDAAMHAGEAQIAAGMLDNLAVVEKHLGHYAEALRLSQEALVQFRRVGAKANVALCLNLQGSLHVLQRDLEGAQVCFEEGLAISEREDFINTRGHLLANLADLALRRGDTDRAALFTRRAIELAQSHGYKAIQAWMHLQSAQIAVRRQQLAEARQAIAHGLRLALELGPQPLLIGGLQPLAEVLRAQGAPDAAVRVLSLAMAHPLTTVPDRDDMQRMLDRWGVAAPQGPLPMTLDELVNRAITEADAAYAPLIAAVRTAA